MSRYIDADELKEAFEKVYPLATNEMGGVVNKRIYDIIDNAPTVEERPKGEWIADDEWGNCHCSVCNFENNHQPYFCENCGANMVTDLCSICKHGDNCERSDKGISFANHSACWKFER